MFVLPIDYMNFEEKNKEESCNTCKYLHQSICVKNHFRVSCCYDYVCNYYKEKEDIKIKKECGFRKIK